MSTPTTPAGGKAVAAPAPATSPVEKFLVLPVIILILAQMGTTGDNGALSLAASALASDLGATTSEIQLANMIYPLVGGAFMIAGGLLGTILGWARTFRAGAIVCAAGEVALALAPNMAVFIWVGRVLVGLGASLLVPSILGLIPVLYSGHNRMVAFGCVGAASGLSAVLPLVLGMVMEGAGMKPTFLLLAAYFAAVAALSLRLPRKASAGERLSFDGQARLPRHQRAVPPLDALHRRPRRVMRGGALLPPYHWRGGEAKKHDDRADRIRDARRVIARLGLDLHKLLALCLGHLDAGDLTLEFVVALQVDGHAGELPAHLGRERGVTGYPRVQGAGHPKEQDGAEQRHAEGLAHVAHGALDAARLGGVSLR